MDSKDLTACCGVYCPDCIWYRNSMSPLAKELKDKLKRVDFERFASIKSPFGAELEHYEEFLSVLNFIAQYHCLETCRKGRGCAGRPCNIMRCAEDKQLEGCWQCEEMEDCDKFDDPRCGDTPRQNLRKIKKLGYEDWIEERSPFYIWQQKDSS